MRGGYGVLVGSLSHQCRIENNVFRYLRHSIPLNGDCYENVISYNYSEDVHWEPWYHRGIGDIQFHGSSGPSIGPHLNLIEGNFVEQIVMDDFWDHNGADNTIFRCSATSEKLRIEDTLDLNISHYTQNIVGVHAPCVDPESGDHGCDSLRKYGYTHYYEYGDDYTQIPDIEASYYYASRPSWYDVSCYWPFKPNVNFTETNPAKFRFLSFNQSVVVFSGWDLYSNICAVPTLSFDNGETWNNINEEFVAINSITANINLNLNNNVIFKTGGNVTLLNGFSINEDQNNYFHAISTSPCESKNDSYEFFSYKPFINTEIIDSSISNSNLHFSNNNIDISEKTPIIYPNPTTGIFFIKTSSNGISICNFTLRNINGSIIRSGLMEYSNYIVFDISEFNAGIYFIDLFVEDRLFNFKILKL